MTVIAWDGSILAVDRMAVCGETKFVRTKLRKLPNGVVLMTSGALDHAEELFDWYAKGGKFSDWPAVQRTNDWIRMIMAKNGQIWEYNQAPVPMLVEDAYSAWGSGGQFAMGAMAMGATAIQAVRVAARHCSSCGYGVNYVRVR